MNSVLQKIAAGLALMAMITPGIASAWYYDWGYYDTYYPTYYDYGYYDYTYYYPTYQSYTYPQYYSYPTITYGYSAPSPYNYSYPVGDTDTFGSPICYWEGYGRGLCDFNPRQPVYDHWTGTWY